MALIDKTKIKHRLDVADVDKNMDQQKMFRLNMVRENERKVKKRTSKVYVTWPRSHVQLAFQMDEKREYDGSNI